MDRFHHKEPNQLSYAQFTVRWGFVLPGVRNEWPIDHADMGFVVHVNISVPYIELFLNEKNMDNEQ
jgi:hypothetical protein